MAEEAGAAWIDLNCGCPTYGQISRMILALTLAPRKTSSLRGGCSNNYESSFSPSLDCMLWVQATLSMWYKDAYPACGAS